MKDRLIIGLLCAVIPVIMLFAWVTYIPQYEPEEGIWVCEELQIQLDYNSGRESFIIKNGTKIQCGQGSDRGVKRIQVYSQDFDNYEYDLGEMIFSADIKKLTDTTMTVLDPITAQEYIFVRIDVNS